VGGDLLNAHERRTPGDDVSNEWLEPVTDDEYSKLPKNGANA